MSYKIPASVHVARWAAIAALVTACGSLFSTMWSERPWWAESHASPQAIHAPAVLPTAQPTSIAPEPFIFRINGLPPISVVESDVTTTMSVDLSERGEVSTPLLMPMSGNPTVDEEASIRHSFEKWILFITVGVGGAYGLIEYLNRRREKKYQATLSDR